MSDFVLLKAVDAKDLARPEWERAQRPLRVLLFQPPAAGAVRSYLPQVSDDSEGIGYKPPLGILYCASTLQAHSRHEVRVIDCLAERLTVESAVRRAVEFRPDVVGISAWTDFWYPAYRLGERIKQALSSTHLTYGGPHLGIYPQETLDVPFVDSVIVGDGEFPLLYLCNMVANHQFDDRVPGLHFKSAGVKSCEGKFFIQKDLDSIPIPDRRLLPIQNYGSVLSKSGLVTTMITSRGCPYKCTFCKLNFQKTLSRSAEQVVEEFRRIRDLGIREIEVYDDTFTWSKRRLVAICEGLIREKIDVEWAVRDRVSNADPELLQLMRRAGCRRIHFGVESGVDRVIERMRKNITTDQARNAVRAAKAAGMTVLTYFMFGNLDETEADMRATIDFALELDADYSEFSITIPYAGTEMYEEALSAGIIRDDYWLDFARQPTPDFLPPQLIETGADVPTLIALRDEAVRRFYFRPRYILHQMHALRSPSEFFRKARMGWQLLKSAWQKRSYRLRGSVYKY